MNEKDRKDVPQAPAQPASTEELPAGTRETDKQADRGSHGMTGGSGRDPNHPFER